MSWFPQTQGRAHVLSFATVPGANWFPPDPRRTADRFDLPPKYLMFPAQFWVHKGHRTLFEAIRLARDRGADVSLVCTE